MKRNKLCEVADDKNTYGFFELNSVSSNRTFSSLNMFRNGAIN